MTVLEELNNHLNRPDAGQCRKFAVDAVKIILKRFRKGMDLKENGGVYELKSTKRRRKRDVNGAGVQPPPQPRSDSVMSRRLRYQARHGTPVLGLSSPRGRRPRCGNEDEPTRPVYRAEGSELDYHDDEFENLSVSNELQHDGDGDGLSVSSELRHDGGPRRVLPSSILGGASRVQRRRPTRGSQLPRVSHLSPSPSRPISPETTNDIPRASLNSPEPPPASTSGPFSNFEASVRLASFLTYIEGFLSANPADYKELLAQLAQGLSRLNLNKSDFMTKIRSIRTVEVSSQTL